MPLMQIFNTLDNLTENDFIDGIPTLKFVCEETFRF